MKMPALVSWLTSALLVSRGNEFVFAGSGIDETSTSRERVEVFGGGNSDNVDKDDVDVGLESTEPQFLRKRTRQKQSSPKPTLHPTASWQDKYGQIYYDESRPSKYGSHVNPLYTHYFWDETSVPTTASSTLLPTNWPTTFEPTSSEPTQMLTTYQPTSSSTYPPSMAPSVRTEAWYELMHEDFESSLGSFNSGGYDVRYYSSIKSRTGVARIQDGNYKDSSIYSDKIALDKPFTSFKVVFSFYTSGMERRDAFCLDHSVDESTWYSAKCWHFPRHFDNDVWYDDFEHEFQIDRAVDDLQIRFRCQANSRSDDVLISDVKLFGFA